MRIKELYIDLLIEILSNRYFKICILIAKLFQIDIKYISSFYLTTKYEYKLVNREIKFYIEYKHPLPTSE